MKKIICAALVLCLCIAALTGCAGSAPAADPAAPAPAAGAGDFPNSPVKVVVVRGAGGSADVVARMFAPYFQKARGTTVVVENIEGGAGKVGLSQVFRAAPDGYTLVLGNFPSYVVTQVIEGGVDYVMSDFEPVVGVSGNEGNVLVVSADSPYNTVEELVAADKANPGAMNMAVTSGLSNSSLAQSMFVDATDFTAATIPYDDGNECITAVMGGHVDLAVCSGVASYLPFAEGTVKVLCTFGPAEDEKLPGVPTFSSMYGEQFAYDVIMGILAPPGTPEEVLKVLRDAGYAAAQDPEYAAAAGESFNVVPRDYNALTEAIKGCYDLTEASRESLGAAA
jgi:tripartite-type tricarboxylate transporter receptor subunit TctC